MQRHEPKTVRELGQQARLHAQVLERAAAGEQSGRITCRCGGQLRFDVPRPGAQPTARCTAACGVAW